MPRASGAGRGTSTDRLLIWYATVVVGVAVVLGTAGALGLGAPRDLFLVGLGVVAATGTIALVATAWGVSRPLREVTRSAERLGSGDLVTPVSQHRGGQVADLAEHLDRMRRELVTRLEGSEQGKQARDATLAALQEGVLLIGPEGDVRYSNPSASRLLGDVPSSVRYLVPPDLRILVTDAARTGTAATEVLTTTTPPRTLRAVATAIPEEGSVVLVLHDVTEALSVDAVRRDFVANASHELKTPVASIQALAETISAAADEDPASMRRFAVQLEVEAVRLSRIITDLLDLSRLEGGTADRQELLLDRLVLEEAAPFRERALRAGLEMSVSTARHVRIRGSARDLGLMIRNLVENALQYTRKGGSVDVSVSIDDGQAVLAVSDTGMGIPQRDQGRVFERFYRVDRARSRGTGGTGLGLAIVRHVAENHGGEVSVQSELGRGTRFAVRLPLASAQS